MKKQKIIILLGSVGILIVLAIFLFVKSGKKDDTIGIYFNSDGGTTIEKMKINKGESILLPTVQKEGYNFIGWYDGDYKVSNSTKYNENTTLYAKWLKEDAKPFTITFDSDGGTVVDNLIVECETELKLPANPIKKGYEFVVWVDKNETPILDKALLSCEDIVLKATWKKVEEKKTITKTEEKKSEQVKEVTYICPTGYTLNGTKCIIETTANEKCPSGTTVISGGLCVTLTESARKDYSKSCEQQHVTYNSFAGNVDGKIVNWGITGCAYYKTSDSSKDTCESHGFKWVTPENACYVKWDTTTVINTCSHLSGYVDVSNPNVYLTNTGINAGCFPTSSKEKYCEDGYNLTDNKCVKTIDATEN